MNRQMTPETSAFSLRYFALIGADQEQEVEVVPECPTPDLRDTRLRNKSVNQKSTTEMMSSKLTLTYVHITYLISIYFLSPETKVVLKQCF